MDGDHFGNEIFDWDEANLEHATRHGVEDFEIEEAVLDMDSVETAAKNVRGERREASIGSTAGGRIVVIVYTDRGGKLRPISARDATETEIQKNMTENKMPKINSMEEVPEFASEAEEAEFWATHELGEKILDRMRPVRESDSLAGRLARRRIAEREAAKYSGKVNLRMSRSLHRDLSKLAKREGVSLNQLATTILARAAGG